MANPPLLKSKLLIPDIPLKALYSQRIRDLNIEKKRLMILVAPSGFGKTTAVLLSLEDKRSHVHWYRMEREDAFLPVFYAHLLETLFSSRGGSSSGSDSTLSQQHLLALQLKQDNLRMLSSIQNLEEDYVLLNAQLCQDAAILLQDAPEKRYLVLDDFQNVADNPAIRETVQYFTVNMPESFSIIVTSRRDPRIITGKLLFRGDVKQIHSDALLFTETETQQLVKEKYDMTLSQDQMDFLLLHSEGWIAGVYMICHGLDFSKKKTWDFPVPEEKGDNIFSLFLIEFLQDLDRDKRSILLALSVLEDFSQEDIQCLFSTSSAPEFINWLEGSNLYIQKMMGNPVKYRFHSLFCGELKRIFWETTPLGEQRQFFEKLGTYYRSIDLHLSIRFFLRAGKEDLALEIAEKEGKEHFLNGTPEKMVYLVKEFSQDQIQKNPYLLLFKGMLCINTHREECHICFLQAMEEFRRIKDYSFLMNTFGMILVIAFQTNDFQYLKEAGNLIPATKIFLAGGAARAKLTISYFISLTGQDKLVQACIIGKFLDKMEIPEDMWQYSYHMIRGIVYYRRGQLQKSAQNMVRILDHSVGRVNDQWRIIGLVSCCNVPYLSRDLEKMQEFINEFFLLGEKYNSAFALGYGYLLSAHQKYQTRDIPGALEALEQSMDAHRIYQGEVLVRETQTIFYLWDETTPPQEALEQARNNMKFLAQEEPGHGIAELAEAVVGILCKRARQWEEAITRLKSSLDTSRRKGALQSVCGIYLHLADLYETMGGHGCAQDYLEKWAQLGEQQNYTFFREMDLGSLERVCKKAMLIEKTKAYAQKLLHLYFQEGESVTEETLKKEKIQIQLLGHFQIQGPDFRIEEKDFKTRKVSGILKYILAGDPRKPISRERLATIFWPEADPKAASTSLRVALYELRKTLTQFDLAFESPGALLEETKEGFRIKEEIIVEKDIQKLETYYLLWKETKSQQNSQSMDAELALLQEICQMYQGHFLENTYYDDWVAVHQEHYFAMAMEAIHAFGQKLIEKGSLGEAEQLLLHAMEMDPLDEASCKLLISIYKEMGQGERAKALSRQFKKRYSQYMGAMPAL